MKKTVLALTFLALPAAMTAAGLPTRGAHAQQAQKGLPTYSSKVVGGKIDLQEPRPSLLMTLEYMRQVINPAANAYWAQAGSLDDEEGTSISGAPEEEYQWEDQLHRAAVLIEAGNGLLTKGRIRNGRCTDTPNASCDAVWNYYSQELIEGGAMAMTAARNKNAKAGFDAGSYIYDSCFGCHARFIPRPANSRYGAPFPSDDEIRAKGRDIGD